MTNFQDKIKIGQVSRQLGISTRTIRYYEEVGLMGDNRQESGSVRFYVSEDVLRLRFILKLKDLGITLKEMHEIAVNHELNNRATDKILPQLFEILDVHSKKVDAKIDNLLLLRKEIEGYRMRVVDCLNKVGGQ